MVGNIFFAVVNVFLIFNYFAFENEIDKSCTTDIIEDLPCYVKLENYYDDVCNKIKVNIENIVCMAKLNYDLSEAYERLKYDKDKRKYVKKFYDLLIQQKYSNLIDTESMKNEFDLYVNMILKDSDFCNIIDISTKIYNLLQSKINEYKNKFTNNLNIRDILRQADFADLLDDREKNIEELKKFSNYINSEITRIENVIKYIQDSNFNEEVIDAVNKDIKFELGNYVKDNIKKIFVHLMQKWYFYDMQQYLDKYFFIIQIEKKCSDNIIINLLIGYLLKIVNIQRAQESCDVIRYVIEYLKSVSSPDKSRYMVDMLNNLIILLPRNGDESMENATVIRYLQNKQIIDNSIFIFFNVFDNNLILLADNKYEEFIIKIIENNFFQYYQTSYVEKWIIFFKKILKLQEIDDDVKCKIINAFLSKIAFVYDYDISKMIYVWVVNQINSMMLDNSVSEKIVTKILSNIYKLDERSALQYGEKSLLYFRNNLSLIRRNNSLEQQDRFPNYRHCVSVYSDCKKNFDIIYDECLKKKYISADIFTILATNNNIDEFFKSWITDQNGLYLMHFKELFMCKGSLLKETKKMLLKKLGIFITNNQEICSIKNTGELYDMNGIIAEKGNFCEGVDEDLYNTFFMVIENYFC